MILAVAERILREVLEPTLKGTAAEGRPFVEVLTATTGPLLFFIK